MPPCVGGDWSGRPTFRIGLNNRTDRQPKKRVGNSTMASKKTPKAPKEKTPCPVSREEFAKNAKPVVITINGSPVVASVKEFSTGSFGWYLNGKIAIMVGDVAVPTQLGFNLTAVNSKDVPK